MRRIRGIRPAFRLPWSSTTRVRREVDDELRFHLDMKVQELVDAGVSPAEAERRARAEFGDLEYTRRYLNSTDRARMHDRQGEQAERVMRATMQAIASSTSVLAPIGIRRSAFASPLMTCCFAIRGTWIW